MEQARKPFQVASLLLVSDLIEGETHVEAQGMKFTRILIALNSPPELTVRIEHGRIV